MACVRCWYPSIWNVTCWRDFCFTWTTLSRPDICCCINSHHGRRSRGGWGAVAPPVFAKFLQNLPFLPQILAFLCLQPPHVPVSPRTFKFTPPSMLINIISCLRDFLCENCRILIFLSHKFDITDCLNF